MGKKKKKIANYKLEESNQIKISQNIASPITYEHPIFCFKFLHKDYSLKRCDKSEKVSLIDRLHALSQMTWVQIQSADKHGFGSEKISLDSIKPKLPLTLTEDIKHLIALRFDGLKPMVGYRNNSIFHIIFLDNKFDVYTH